MMGLDDLAFITAGQEGKLGINRIYLGSHVSVRSCVCIKHYLHTLQTTNGN